MTFASLQNWNSNPRRQTALWTILLGTV